MKNISINGYDEFHDFDRKIDLRDGTLVIQKNKNEILNVYMVIPFRDNKNAYNGCSTASYCSLLNIDTGKLSFEERCSRNTTERRILRHISRAGYSYPYNPNSTENEYIYYDMKLQTYKNGNYKINLSLSVEEK